MAGRTLCAALCAAGLLAAPPAAAQTDAADLGLAVDRDQPVALVADRIAFDERQGLLTAEGAVEVFYGQRVLRATRIVYDSATERITAEGPMTLDDGAGTVVIADAAALDADLRNGVIEGAKALIASGAGSMAAVRGERIDGRYTLLSKTVYSSCEVCAAQPTPLWRIRADRVLHDADTRDIHYENATFEVLGAPVGFLPYFRHADPSVKRRSGFLVPTFQSATTYGLAAKLPYFLVLGPSADATITPFPTTDDGPIVEGQYRQRFDFGGFDLDGSVGFLDIGEGEGDELRGHLFGTGRFGVDAFGLDGFGLRPVSTLGFDVAVTSDDGYLRRYEFSDADRLSSEVFLENYGARDFFTVAGVYFQSLREDEPAGEIPLVLPEFAARRGFTEDVTGGDVGLFASGVGLSRTDGRDVARLSLGADWERRVILSTGVTLRGFATGRADVYRTRDDPEIDDATVRFVPQAGVDMRLPLVKATPDASHFLEFGGQFIVAPIGLNDSDIPNEDSVLVEFDETAIFDVNRFPGVDRVETGSRVNLGVRYARTGVTDRWRLGASAGRVLRLAEQTDFSENSGLADRLSDWVGSWSVGYGDDFTFINRLRVDDEFRVARNEVGALLRRGRFEVDATYVFLAEDEELGSDVDREEFRIDGDVRIAPQWTIGGFLRRDLEEDRFVRTRARIEYRSECAGIEAYVGRNFTESRNNPPSTSVGVRLRLFGTADGAGRRSGVCEPLL